MKTIKTYLGTAAKAWAKATLNVQKFADAYVDAVFDLKDEAVEAFRSAYPMFGEREWKRLELIGNGELMPQFFFKSDFFVGKLLKLNSSMRIQKALVGASNDGRIRIDRGNGPEKVALADLTAKEDKALVMLLSEENEKLSPGELKNKFRLLVAKINKSNRRGRPAWELRTVNGRSVARFNRACSMERSDLEDVLRSVKKGRCVGATRPSREILDELVNTVCRLESLRDDEWDFEEAHGDRCMWNDEVCKEHDELLNDIQNCRDHATKLVREATGRNDLYV